MKKVSTVVLVSMIALAANAQFQKGNKVLGFGLGISNQNNKGTYTTAEQSSNGFNLSGSFSLAKAISESRLNGFGMSVGYNKHSYQSNAPLSTDQFNESYYASANYFMRKYKSLGKGFFVFGEGQGSLNYNRQVSSNIQNYPKMNTYGASIGIYPGLAYKWNEIFLFELRFADFVGVSYGYSEAKSETVKSHSHSFGLGTSLGLGYLNNIGIGARWIIK